MKTKILIILLINSNIFACCLKPKVSQKYSKISNQESEYQESLNKSKQNGQQLIKSLVAGDGKSAQEISEQDDVDVNASDENGTTALMWACAQGFSEIVEILLKRGAMTVSKNCYGLTAAMYAFMISNEKIIKLVLNHTSQLAMYLITNINRQYLQEHVHKIIRLIESDEVYVNFQNINKRTMLYEAAGFDEYKEIVISLLKNGADPNIKDKFGMTALMQASYSNNVEIVKLLLENNADVNLKTDLDMTALRLAIIKGNTEIVKLLLDRGATINSHDPEFINLKYGFHRSSNYILELLKKKGLIKNEDSSTD